MTPTAVISTILLYALLLCAIAWGAGRRVTNRVFFTGNRENGWAITTLAMIGAAMSGVTFVSVPGSVAVDSFSYLQMVAGFTVGQFVVAFGLVPLFYRLQLFSLYEYLDHRFGGMTHRTGAWCFFLSKMVAASLKVLIVCVVLQQLVFEPWGMSFGLNVACTMGLVWLYTRRGGVRSVIRTDVLHTLCLVTAIVLTILCIVRALDWSVVEAVDALRDSSYSRILFMDDPASARYGWKMFFGGLFTLIAMTGLDQDMMQRNLSCRTVRDAQINISLTAFCQIGVILLLLSLGALLYLYAEHTGLVLPADGDAVFAAVATDGSMPRIVGILFIVGLISSTYSSAGSALTALTTTCTVDLLKGPERWGEEPLRRVRMVVHTALAVAMGVLIFALGRWADESLINVVFKVAGYTYGPILGIFTFGILTRRTIRERWLPLVVVGAPAISAFMQNYAADNWNYYIGFELIAYNALLTVTGMYVLSIGRPKQSTEVVQKTNCR